MSNACLCGMFQLSHLSSTSVGLADRHDHHAGMPVLKTSFFFVTHELAK
jgi:hypothetical protein